MALENPSGIKHGTGKPSISCGFPIVFRIFSYDVPTVLISEIFQLAMCIQKLMSKMNTLIMDRKFIRWNEHKIIMTQMNNYYVYYMVCIFSVRTMCIIYNFRDYIYIYIHMQRNLQCQVSLPQDLWIYLHNKKNISTWLAEHPRFVWKLPINHRLFVRMDGVEPPFHLSIFLAGISRNYGHVFFFFQRSIVFYCKIDSQQIPLVGSGLGSNVQYSSQTSLHLRSRRSGSVSRAAASMAARISASDFFFKGGGWKMAHF